MAKKSEESAPAPAPAAPSFEKELGRLEAIVSRLEAGSLGLDEAIKLYEEGVRSLKTCQARLAEAEARIRQLAEGQNGPELGDFAPGAPDRSDKSDQSDLSDTSDGAAAPRARKPRGRGLF